MLTITNIIRRFTVGADNSPEPVYTNPSEVLRINRDDPSGTLEFRSLDPEMDNPSKVLRVSWIKRDDIHGIMKTVWLADEVALH